MFNRLRKDPKLLFLTPIVLVLLLAVSCGGTSAEPQIIEKQVIVEKEVIKEVPVDRQVVVEKEVIREVVKEVPVEKVVIQEVLKEVIREVEKRVVVVATPMVVVVSTSTVAPPSSAIVSATTAASVVVGATVASVPRVGTGAACSPPPHPVANRARPSAEIPRKRRPAITASALPQGGHADLDRRMRRRLDVGSSVGLEQPEPGGRYGSVHLGPQVRQAP